VIAWGIRDTMIANRFAMLWEQHAFTKERDAEA
jgi:hypothetical protein